MGLGLALWAYWVSVELMTHRGLKYLKGAHKCLNIGHGLVGFLSLSLRTGAGMIQTGTEKSDLIPRFLEMKGSMVLSHILYQVPIYEPS